MNGIFQDPMAKAIDELFEAGDAMCEALAAEPLDLVKVTRHANKYLDARIKINLIANPPKVNN
jgi:hypothetical protein